MTSLNRAQLILFLMLTLALVPREAFAWSRAMPTDAQAAAAKAKANQAKSMSCLDKLRGLASATGDAYRQLLNLKVDTNIPINEYADNYGNLCVMRQFAEDAEKRGMGKSANRYACYADVKNLIHDKAPWMTNGRLPGGSAFMAKEDLENDGFIDILPSNPDLYDNPDLAPPGAMIVYSAKEGVICRFTRIFCSNVKHGDIQVRTPNGYFAGYFSPNAMSHQYRGSEVMEVSAVMIKPMKVTSFNKQKDCFETEPYTVPTGENTWPSRASRDLPNETHRISRNDNPESL